MKHSSFLVVLVLLCSLVSRAQESFLQGAIRPLKIGDAVPEIEINNVQQYPRSKVSLSQFRGKLLILDFWFGTCKGCIEAFPKMQSLQKKFGDSIEILLVNYEDEKTIEATFKKWSTVPGYRLPQLPSITGDTLLHRLFPFKYYPHEVWIDPSGKVLAFTGAEEVTEDNIAGLLRNERVTFEMKRDSDFFDVSDGPLLPQLYPAFQDGFKYYSIIMNYFPARGRGTTTRVIDSAAGTIRVSRLNMSILELVGNALGGGTGGNPYESPRYDFGKRIELVVRDSSRFFWKEGSGSTQGEWERQHLYSYEAVVPIGQGYQLFTNMLHAVESYFDLQCTIEKRKKFCYALVRNSTKDKIRSVNKTSLTLFNADSTKLQIRKGFTWMLIEALATSYRDGPLLFVDKTGYTGRIDLEIDKKLVHHLDELKKVLQKEYDLDLVPLIDDVDVLVIKDRNARIAWKK